MAIGHILLSVTGFVGQDPEIRKLDSGAEVASFSVAATKRFGGGGGREAQEHTEWFRCQTFNEKLIDLLDKFVHKGDAVQIVSFDIRTRKWTDRDGVDRFTTDVNVFDIQLLERPPAGGGGGRDSRDNRGGGASRADDRGRAAGGRDDRGGGRGDTRAPARGGRDDRYAGRDDAPRGGRDGGRDVAPRGGRDDPPARGGRDDAPRGGRAAAPASDFDDDPIPF